MDRRIKINVYNPRQLRKQQAWYYLPCNKDKHIEIHKQLATDNQAIIRLPARKLYKELKAIYEN